MTSARHAVRHFLTTPFRAVGAASPWFRQNVPFTQRAIVYMLAHAVVFAVGIAFVVAHGTTKVAIGTSLIGAAVAGWVMFAYILVTDRWSRRIEVLTEFGIVDAFPARSVRIRETYDSRLSRAERAIDVLGFGQRALRQDHADHFRAWAARATVRVLLLDPAFMRPDASVAEQRDMEEREAAGTIAGDVTAFLSIAQGIVSATGGRFRVRLYRCLPTVNIFRIDDDLFWGPYLIHEQSRNTPTFHVRRGGLLFERFVGHFETIWSDDDLSHEAF